MPTNITLAPHKTARLLFAGLPAESWAFALRIWLACLLALYTSFWLELEAPSSAAITVAILALPTRGQGMEKAEFRVIATIIGLSASILFAGVFSQTDLLLLAALSAWTGLCVFFLGLLDGNRAYAAALSCYTVALIFIQQIDTPQHVFAASVARGSAIAVGIFSTWLINDVLGAPNYQPIVTARLDALLRQVRDLRHLAAQGGALSTGATGTLLRDISGLRPDVESLVAESSSGRGTRAAARSAMVSLVSSLYYERALASLPISTHDKFVISSQLIQICRSWLRAAIDDAEADQNIKALQTGQLPRRLWRAPLYRSYKIALEIGARAAFYFALAATFFVVTGWPTTELSLSLVAVVIGLGFTTPSLRMFTVLAGIVTPIAGLLAGILKYVIFNGVSDFQLLAIGLAPVIIGLSLLISMPNTTLSALGRFSLIFTLAIFMPANPQSYDPNVYVITCLLFCLATGLVFIAQLIIPPLSNDRRCELLLQEAQVSFGRQSTPSCRQLAPEEAAFRCATWVAQIATASGNAQPDAIDKAMRTFDWYVAFRHCKAELDHMKLGSLSIPAEAAMAALTARDPNDIFAAAEMLRLNAEGQHICADAACANLVLAGLFMQSSELDAQLRS